MHFLASKNAAKYEALLHGLRITTALGIHRLIILGDSLLIVNQANKEWSCLDDKMLLYFQKLLKLENNFDVLEYWHILQGKNEVADELPKLGSSQVVVRTRVFLSEFHEPSFSKTLAKASKVVESSQETPPPIERHGNSLRLAYPIHNIPQDRGLARRQGQTRTIALPGSTLHSAQ
jgi:hypothetical protein